jgi:hypothetical protein
MPFTAPARPLTDGELSFRPPRKADAGPLGRACADPDLAAWVHPPAPGPVEAAHRLLAELRGGWEAGKAAAFSLSRTTSCAR